MSDSSARFFVVPVSATSCSGRNNVNGSAIARTLPVEPEVKLILDEIDRLSLERVGAGRVLELLAKVCSAETGLTYPVHRAHTLAG